DRGHALLQPAPGQRQRRHAPDPHRGPHRLRPAGRRLPRPGTDHLQHRGRLPVRITAHRQPDRRPVHARQAHRRDPERAAHDLDLDVIQFIYGQVPWAVGTVVLLTYVLLFLLTGSVVLPLKAIILNFLSIGASFGALVFIFQQGHFSSLLGFTPQSLDPSIPV